MKITKIEKEQEPEKPFYPIIMELTTIKGWITLALSDRTGINLQVSTGYEYQRGYRDDFICFTDKQYWKPFHGKLVLEND